MRYQIRIAGKIFEGNDPRTLIKRAVAAMQPGERGNRPSPYVPHRKLVKRSKGQLDQTLQPRPPQTYQCTRVEEDNRAQHSRTR